MPFPESKVNNNKFKIIKLLFLIENKINKFKDLKHLLRRRGGKRRKMILSSKGRRGKLSKKDED